MLSFDVEAFGRETFLGGWDEKDDKAAEFEASDSDYRVWKPLVTNTEDGGLRVSMKLDHIRNLWPIGVRDDHASLEIVFNGQGRMQSVGTGLDIAGEADLPEQLITASAELAGGPKAAQAADLAARATEFLYNFVVKVSDGGGREYFPTVIRHVMDLVGQYVGKGADVLSGTVGFDLLEGGTGNDALHAAGGDDVLIGGAGVDTLDGGSGRDTADYTGEPHRVYAVLTADGNGVASTSTGADALSGIENLTGSAFDDTLVGDAAANRLTGLGGDDTLHGAGGADTLDGGQGLDTADYSNSAGGVVVSLTGTAAQDTGSAGADALVSVENLRGSAHDDRLSGDAGANTLFGAAGSDTLEGGAGYDILDGGPGADRLIGGPGGDTYRIDADDTVEELPGGELDAIETTMPSTVLLPHLGAIEVLRLVEGSAATDASGNGYDNTIIGNSRSNSLHGGEGSGDDVLLGNAGDDVLSGGGGEDTLFGGGGTDVLFGGGLSEADLFVFQWERIAPDYKATGAAGNFINTYAPAYLPTGLAAYLYDFHEWDGDRLDLSGIDADLGAAGDQAFRYVGTASFTGAGQVRIQTLNDHVVVEADVDGGGADWKIALAGAHPYITSDTFLL